ncbi:CCN family member 1-like isoform X2 [Ambystoma mexicanum]|uniref:CCN family member 1-like isoform X2 n=1 Tax=Ambystoma mexicanum TaxID=8296 RepID=UPI0037E8AB8C
MGRKRERADSFFCCRCAEGHAGKTQGAEGFGYSASQEGRSCFFNGSVYLHEERFQIACHSSCICLDGAVGCMPRCPLSMPVITPGCSDMQQVEVPGQCCREWRCVESNRLEDWLTGPDVLRVADGNVIGENPGRAWERGSRPLASHHHHPGGTPRRLDKLKTVEDPSAMIAVEGPDGSGTATREGHPCSVKDAVYQNGDRFQMACHSSCVCLDGSVACTSLCPPTHPARMPGCLVMEQVAVPGQCCKQWRCLEFSNGLQHGTAEHTGVAEAQQSPRTQKRSRNLAFLGTDTPRRRRIKGKRSSNDVEVDRCQKEPTEWTDCSKTCGTGISTRLVWSNGSCTPRRQRRVCMVRPCGAFLEEGKYEVIKAGKKCTRLVRPLDAQTWTFKGCQSQRPLVPNYCGYCSNGGSCTPTKTHTVPVKFQCEGGAEMTRKVMWVQNCGCRGKRRRKGDKTLQLGEPTQNA